jgi:hypothetical protein
MPLGFNPEFNQKPSLNRYKTNQREKKRCLVLHLCGGVALGRAKRLNKSRKAMPLFYRFAVLRLQSLL